MRQQELFREKNFLYAGDNLRILRHRVASESVDLIYLDPPFNSNQDYNVLFKERSGDKAASQMKAFSDTWKWDQAARDAYRDAIENGPERLADVMQAFNTILGPTHMLAYLSMMAPRLVEMHRVLRNTGSLFLHCDPTASHYLKLLMDAIFGPVNFKNEIIWKRTHTHADARRFGSIHDTLLFYAKDSSRVKWNPQHRPHSEEYLKSHYSKMDENGRRYQLISASAPGHGKTHPAMRFGDKWIEPPPGRMWSWTQENIDRLWAEGRFAMTRTGRPRYKLYADEKAGTAIGSIWSDISAVNSQASERIGYPTQKPVALLERIILATTDDGDTVLDPFCGCGTSIDAAQMLNRRWVGIDITQIAINVVEDRLQREYGSDIKRTYLLIRDPESVPDALALAKADKYQFQWWVLDRLGAAEAHRKKGADKGVDGRLNFYDADTGPPKKIVIQVKGGKTGPRDVRDLRGVMERDKATIGVLVTIKEPTRQMKVEALEAGTYHSDAWERDYDRFQIITVDDLIRGNQIDYPSGEFHAVSGYRRRRASSQRRKVPARSSS